MMLELFDTSQCRKLSPYKEWERHNRIKTHFAPHCEEEPWCATRSIKSCAESACANGERWSVFGRTRDEAISKLCRKLNIPPFGA